MGLDFDRSERDSEPNIRLYIYIYIKVWGQQNFRMPEQTCVGCLCLHLKDRYRFETTPYFTTSMLNEPQNVLKMFKDGPKGGRKWLQVVTGQQLADQRAGVHGPNIGPKMCPSALAGSRHRLTKDGSRMSFTSSLQLIILIDSPSSSPPPHPGVSSVSCEATRIDQNSDLQSVIGRKHNELIMSHDLKEKNNCH